MSQRVEEEERRIRWLDATMTRLESDFEQAGLRVEILPIRREGDGEGYESEIEIYLWEGNRIVDALAYPLWRSGQPIAGEAEWKERVSGDLRGILRRPHMN